MLYFVPCCICGGDFGPGEVARNSAGVTYHRGCAEDLGGCATCRRPFGPQVPIGEKAGETYKCIYCVAEITSAVEEQKTSSPVSVADGWSICLSIQ